MKIYQLEALAACADAGSIRAAARQLGVSQPAITHAIRDLETQQQLSLVIRSPTGLRFTNDGTALLKHARIILNQLKSAQTQMDSRRGLIEGKLSVALTPWLSHIFLADFIREFREKMPKVQLEFYDSLELTTQPLLRDGSIALSISNAPASYHQLYNVDPLLEYETGVIVRRGHPAESAKTIHELLNYNWIMNYAPGQEDTAMQELFWNHGARIDKSQIFLINSISITRSLTLSSDMCSLAARVIASIEPFSSLYATLDLKEKFSPGILSIISRRNNPTGTPAQCFIDCVRNVLRKKLRHRLRNDTAGGVGPLIFLK